MENEYTHEIKKIIEKHFTITNLSQIMIEVGYVDDAIYRTDDFEEITGINYEKVTNYFYIEGADKDYFYWDNLGHIVFCDADEAYSKLFDLMMDSLENDPRELFSYCEYFDIDNEFQKEIILAYIRKYRGVYHE